MKKYVLGFMFSADKKHVLLILKNHPEWQAGSLNGVGGKILRGDEYIASMVKDVKVPDETDLDALKRKMKEAGTEDAVIEKFIIQVREHGEPDVDAMVREFREEVGIDTGREDWKYVGQMQSNNSKEPWSVAVFKAFSDDVFDAQQLEDERPVTMTVGSIRNRVGEFDTIGNVPMLIEMCLCEDIMIAGLHYL